MLNLITVVGVAVLAQTPPPAPAEQPRAAESEQSAADRFTLDLSLTAASGYFYRGIVQRPDTLNIQPAAQLTFEAWSSDSSEGGSKSLSLYVGGWSNFSADRAADAGSGFREYWYEHDTYVGASFSVERLTFDAVYTWYDSPAGDFSAVEELMFTTAYDDSGHWDSKRGFAINPSVSVAFETRNAASGPDSGVWLGIGIEPGFQLTDSPAGPVGISFPVSVGISIDDYYQRSDGSSDAVGVAEAGVTLSVDLPERFGPAAPTVSLSAMLLTLHGAAEDINGGDGTEVVFSASTSWSF